MPSFGKGNVENAAVVAITMNRLSQKTLRRLLWVLSWLPFIGAGIVFYWAGWAPLHRPATKESSRTHVVPSRAEGPSIAPLRLFADVWNKPLQRSLIDRPTSTRNGASAPAHRVARPDLQLQGTYDERYAVFRLPGADGTEQTVQEADHIAGGQVMRITATKVVLEVRGITFEYRVKQTD